MSVRAALEEVGTVGDAMVSAELAGQVAGLIDRVEATGWIVRRIAVGAERLQHEQAAPPLH